MNPNPAADVIAFLTQPQWTTAVFWLLLVASAAIATWAFATIPEQRRFVHFGNWGCRFVVGAMWWQQTLWKLPPYYTDQPGQPFGATGLAYWMTVEGKSAAIPLQGYLVNHVLLPHFYLFAPLVYAAELLTAISLILGLFVPLWGLIGALQILNLWLGLYSAPGEWPWTYFFLLLLMLVFAGHRYGRSLGVDAILMARSGRNRLIAWLS